MTSSILYALTGVALFTMGLWGTLIKPDWLRKILSLNIMGTGVFLFLVAIADRRGDQSPDPVPHAMVLTGIVVAVSATAVALALACRIAAFAGPEVNGMPSEETEPIESTPDDHREAG